MLIKLDVDSSYNLIMEISYDELIKASSSKDEWRSFTAACRAFESVVEIRDPRCETLYSSILEQMSETTFVRFKGYRALGAGHIDVEVIDGDIIAVFKKGL